MEKQSNIKTNIVIVTWNALEYTKVTLKRLFETVHHDYYLTIVDNYSSDGTQELIKSLNVPSNCRGYTFILNETNGGYGGAINQGFEVSKKNNTLYTCVCNNDLYFQNNWLEKMEAEMDSDDKLGLVGAMRPSLDVFHYDEQISLKTIVDTTPEEFGPDEEISHITKNIDFDEFCEKVVSVNQNNIQYLNCPPETVVTCCALARNSAILDLGYFADKQFEVYGCEGIDLSWALFNKGYKLAILNKIYVHHFRHKSIKSSNLNREKYIIENNTRFVKKWENEIFYFLKQEELTGVELDEMFDTENNYRYFFLRMINKNTLFYEKYKLIKDRLYIDEVTIDKPIGNLYRKNHVLVLVRDSLGNFILGQKENFYPPNMSRMLGGGLKNGEDPKEAIAREIKEEVGVDLPVDDIISLGRTITKANTKEGVMYMNVYLFAVTLKSKVAMNPGDDISGVRSYSLEELKGMIRNMFTLEGEFQNESFYYRFNDWGIIYGFIHQRALDAFLQYENNLSIQQ